MNLTAFQELIAQVMEQGIDRDTACRYASLIAGLPIRDEAGNILVMENETVIAKLKPLKFYSIGPRGNAPEEKLRRFLGAWLRQNSGSPPPAQVPLTPALLALGDAATAQRIWTELLKEWPVPPFAFNRPPI